MAARADDKLAVLLALVPYLYAQRVVSVAEAADQLDLTPEAIREAVRLIAVTGVAGADDVPLPNEMFDIDWDAFLDEDVIVLSNAVAIGEYLRFSPSEAAALISGLEYVSKLRLNDAPAIADLIVRLRAGTIGRPVPLLLTPADAVGAAADDPIATIIEARSAGKRLEFDYRSGKDETLRRQVDPVQLTSDGPLWYLRAYCHTRHDMRMFRIDRMDAIAVTDLPVDEHDELPPEHEFFHPSDSDFDVVVEVAPGGLPFLVDYLADDRRQRVGERTRVTLRIAHESGLVRLVSSLPGLVRVVGPESARRAVAEWAETALAQQGAGPQE